MATSRSERLRLIFQRLRDANPAATLAEAKTLLSSIMNTVEDELSEVPADAGWANAGRLYPPVDNRCALRLYAQTAMLPLRRAPPRRQRGTR